MAYEMGTALYFTVKETETLKDQVKPIQPEACIRSYTHAKQL